MRRPLRLLALSLSDEKGYDCWVVAPSLIPKKPGDRVTTDRRDAVQLARLARSGISQRCMAPRSKMKRFATSRRHVKTPSAIAKTPSSVSKLLLRHDIRYVGRANGGRPT